METIVKRTSKSDQRIASDSISRLKRVVKPINERSKSGIKITIEETEEVITIPEKAFSMLISIVSSMSEGKSVVLTPTNSELTTQQASDRLNISRPHLVKLLENNTIPFKRVGSHRRILVKDILRYEKKQQRIREEQLSFLSSQAQELNLGYE